MMCLRSADVCLGGCQVGPDVAHAARLWRVAGCVGSRQRDNVLHYPGLHAVRHYNSCSDCDDG